MPERDSAYPILVFSMDVNALNYCRFSLLRLDSSQEHLGALIAVPNLVDSSFVCIIPESYEKAPHGCAAGRRMDPPLNGTPLCCHW